MPGLQVIGTAGELPKAPSTPIQFMEDMTDTQIAQAVRTTDTSLHHGS
jgi:hypothetical protein